MRNAALESRLLRRALMPSYRSVAARRLLRSGVFSAEWYSAQTGVSFTSDRQAVRDFVATGRRQGYSPHPLVWPALLAPDAWDRPWPEPTLRALNPAATDVGSPVFDVDTWVAAHPEARRHPDGPLAHFLSVAGPETPVPTADGHVLLLGDLVRLSLAAARMRVDERLAALHRAADVWDPAPEREVLEQSAGWPAEGDPLPTVSVIMPVRDRPDLVAVAIASVQAQTYPHWELVVVDDGSTDSTPDVVRRLAASDPRIRLVESESLGVSRARNIGLDTATGDVLAFLDSDNTWHPDLLRVMLARIEQTGSRFAHSAVRGTRDGVVTYRCEDGGYDDLLKGNFIDLNAVVVRRTLFDEIGRFDENLPRMVDWDLAIRLAAVERPLLVPFLGVFYDDTRVDYPRVTTTELRSWREVVLAKHQIDWDALVRRDRVPGMVSVVMPTYQDFQMTVTAVRAVLATSGDRPVEVVVIDNGSRLAVCQMLTVLLSELPGVRLLRRPSNDHFALGSDLGFAEAVGEYVLFLNNDTEVQPGWLEPLVAALAEPGVVGAQPLLQYPDGTIQCAGVVFPGPPGSEGLPSHFLVNHPPADAVRLGEIRTHAVTAAALLMRSSDLARLHGFDPIYTNGFEDVDLCLRAGGDTDRCFRVVAASRVVHHESKTPGRRKKIAVNRRVFLQKWRGRIPVERGDLWRSAGFEVAHYDVEATSTDPTAPRIGRPVVVRDRRDPDAALRWAFKLPIAVAALTDLPEPLRRVAAVADALEALGQQACLDPVESHDRTSSYLDDVLVAVRGGRDVATQPGRINLIWVIDDGSEVTDEELQRYDGVLAADRDWAARVSLSTGLPVEVLTLPPAQGDGAAADADAAARVLLTVAAALRTSIAAV